MKFFALLLLPVFSLAQIKADKTISLFNNKAEIKVPKELTEMTAGMWTIKYHDLPRPELVLTDENGEVNLLAELTKQPIADSQVVLYKDFRVSNLKKTRKDVTILGEGMKKIGGKNIGFIKFTSQASDQKIFNYYFFTSVNGKIMLLTFNCIEKLQPDWEKVADQMLNSIKVK